MNLPPLRTHVLLTGIGGYWNESDPPDPPYLWTVFFKVDGATVSVVGLAPQGNATVVGTEGNEGDLGDAPISLSAGTWVVPASLGSFLTTLTAIPAPAPIGPIPGLIGCVAILMDWADTPSDAVAAGHAALNTSIQQGIDQLIPTFGLKKRTVTPADITTLIDQVTTAVKNAVLNQLSIWQKAYLAFGTPDIPLSQAIFIFNQQQLAASPPTGIPMRLTNTITVPIGPQGSHTGKTMVAQSWSFAGTIVADPFPLSMRRILTGIGHPPPVRIRSVVGGGQISVIDWVNAVR